MRQLRNPGFVPATAPLLNGEYDRCLRAANGGRWPMGYVIREGFDRDGYERRERLEAVAVCPKCGADVPMWAETDEWTRVQDGNVPATHNGTRWTAGRGWVHSGYGPPTGFCCGLLFVDEFGRGKVLDLEAAR